MKTVAIILYEWKHFSRSPFKLVALALFVVAALYGLHNGARLYSKQKDEIEKINQRATEQTQKVLEYYDKGEKGPADRPWVDVTTPFWAIWNLPTYHFKTPSPTLVYGIGQAEQYGFYKQITVWASPYDADMAEEIANPERIQTGTLDFAFAVLFLLPLLLLILTYDLKSTEAEQGFLSLIYVQTASKHTWLLARVGFYVVMLLLVIVGLLLYGASLTDVFATEGRTLGKLLLYVVLYLAFWTVLYYLILQKGTSIMGNTLQMMGLWLLFAFVIPAAVHQWIGIAKPANLMTDLIDAQRDGRETIFAQPDSLIDAQLFSLYPTITTTAVAQDTTRRGLARNLSASALVNDLMKESIAPIIEENEAKNKLIRITYWFNPLTYFQNQLNALTQTHFDDYGAYRSEVQRLIDKRIGLMVEDIWQEKTVNKERFLEYEELLRQQ